MIMETMDDRERLRNCSEVVIEVIKEPHQKGNWSKSLAAGKQE